MTQKKCKISNTGFQLPFNTLEIYLAPVVAFVVHHNIWYNLDLHISGCMPKCKREAGKAIEKLSHKIDGIFTCLQKAYIIVTDSPFFPLKQALPDVYRNDNERGNVHLA